MQNNERQCPLPKKQPLLSPFMADTHSTMVATTRQQQCLLPLLFVVVPVGDRSHFRTFLGVVLGVVDRNCNYVILSIMGPRERVTVAHHVVERVSKGARFLLDHLDSIFFFEQLRSCVAMCLALFLILGHYSDRWHLDVMKASALGSFPQE